MDSLATRPVLEAVYTYATTQQPASKLLFGMDANTYTTPEKDQYGAADFAAYYRSKALSSCYGDYPNIHNYTTFHARTHLQPQLNKAITFSEKQVKGDKNPKDYIVFFAEDYEVSYVAHESVFISHDACCMSTALLPSLDCLLMSVASVFDDIPGIYHRWLGLLSMQSSRVKLCCELEQYSVTAVKHDSICIPLYFLQHSLVWIPYCQ